LSIGGESNALIFQMADRKSKRHSKRKWLVKRSRKLLRRRTLRRKRRRKSGPSGRRKNVILKRTQANISLPEVLSITDNSDETIAFFTELERLVFEKKSRLIKIDHANLENITPESALLLIAEYERLSFHAPGLLLQAVGRSPVEEVEDLLEGIGYNNRFTRVSDPSTTFSSKSRAGITYIRHKTGKKVVVEEVSALVEHFQRLVNFSSRRSERLLESLLECMANSVGHAYPEHRSLEFRWGERRWWLLGYTDNTCREVYFAFLDQGIGMPSTLKRKFRDAKLLFPLSDSELVLKAFMEPRSRTGYPFRGRGLTTLARYVNEAPDGELIVQTTNVRCRFAPRQKPISEKTASGLAGTLLVWHIKGGL
jgi:hypothetical protein